MILPVYAAVVKVLCLVLSPLVQQRQGRVLGDSQSQTGQGPGQPALLALLDQGVALDDL